MYRYINDRIMLNNIQTVNLFINPSSVPFIKKTKTLFWLTHSLLVTYLPLQTNSHLAHNLNQRRINVGGTSLRRIDANTTLF